MSADRLLVLMLSVLVEARDMLSAEVAVVLRPGT